MEFARNDSGTKCFYYGRTGHIARYFYRKKIDESRHRNKRYTGHFVGKDQNHDLKLFVSDVALFAEIDEAETSMKLSRRGEMLQTSTWEMIECIKLKGMEIFL